MTVSGLFAADRDGQALAADRSAGGEHLPAVAGSHASAEAMGADPADVVGLVSTLGHDEAPVRGPRRAREGAGSITARSLSVKLVRHTGDVRSVGRRSSRSRSRARDPGTRLRSYFDSRAESRFPSRLASVQLRKLAGLATRPGAGPWRTQYFPMISNVCVSTPDRYANRAVSPRTRAKTKNPVIS